MPAKRENKIEYSQLSLKIDKKLNADVEKFWRENLYQDKSTLVREALEYYIHTIKCPKCGTRCYPKLLKCPECGSGLPTIVRLEKAYDELGIEIFGYADDMDYLKIKYDRIHQEYLRIGDELGEPFDSDYQRISEILELFWKKVQIGEFFKQTTGDGNEIKELSHRAREIIQHPEDSRGDVEHIIRSMEIQAQTAIAHRDKVKILDASLDLISDMIKKYQSEKEVSKS